MTVKNHAWRRRYQKLRKARGLCISCAQPSTRGRMRCVYHRQLENAKRSMRHHGKKAAHHMNMLAAAADQLRRLETARA